MQSPPGAYCKNIFTGINKLDRSIKEFNWSSDLLELGITGPKVFEPSLYQIQGKKAIYMLLVYL